MEGLVISDAVKDLIINIINIIVLFVIVRALAYKPVKKFLDARKERIAKALSDAAATKAAAEGEAEKYNELLGQNRREAEELIGNAERTAKQNAAEITAAAKKRADEIIEKARADAKQEHDAKLASMQDEITGLAFDISKQILAREVTDEDNMRISDEFFAKYHADSAE